MTSLWRYGLRDLEFLQTAREAYFPSRPTRVEQGEAYSLKRGSGLLQCLIAVTILASCGGGGGGSGGGNPASPPAAGPSPSGPIEPTPPTTPSFDLSGLWTITHSLAGPSNFTLVEGSGVLEVTNSNGSVLGDWRSSETAVKSSGLREPQGTQQQTVLAGTDSGIRFDLKLTSYSLDCTYTASITEAPIPAMDGTVDCPAAELQGAWSAARGAPESVSLPSMAYVTTSEFSTCAIAHDGGSFCWGVNPLGQLGTGDTSPRITPHVSLQAYAMKKVSLAAGGGGSGCGIDLSGDTYCWGNQEGGRLGDGFPGASWQFSPEPVLVSGGHKFIDIAVGGDHACAVESSGKAYCWGHNEVGQLGTGDLLNRTVPALVAGDISFKAIVADVLVSCGLATDGSAYCWGGGWNGTLGNGAIDDVNVPTLVKGNFTFDSIQLGIWTACGVTTQAVGYCWGYNGSGELGNGLVSDDVTTVPVQVSGGIAWKSISPGIAVTCGVSQSGTGYCWGGNLSGERGDGGFPAPNRATPGPVSGNILFKSIDVDWHSCCVAVDGVVYCWGPGIYGSVGDGSLTDRGEPTAVTGS